MRVRISIGAEQVMAREVVYLGDWLPPGDAGTGEWFSVLSISRPWGSGEERVDWHGSKRYRAPAEAVAHLLADLEEDGGFPVRDLFEAGRKQIDELIESAVRKGTP